MPSLDSQYYLRRQEEALAGVQSKIAGQTGILNLRDDPMAASHAVRYESYLSRLERFEQNTLYAQEQYNAVDSYLQQSVSIMQRIRELAMQGANGVYTGDDLTMMGVEVNELLNELVSIANATGPDGTRLFAGDKAFTEPFRVITGSVEGGGQDMITGVEYRGAGAARATEISERSYTTLDISGGEAFWAEKMQIRSGVNGNAADNYQVPASGAFSIDGQEIKVSSGDTINAIVAKINDSGAPVKASVDPVTRALALEGTNAHFIRLEDAPGSTVMRDLGLITDTAAPDAPNWNRDAEVSGGSLFDMVIRLRDALFQDNQEFIGGQGIAGMDLALGNVETRLADIGSRATRARETWQRLNAEIPTVTAALDRASGLDLTTAAMELASMNSAHTASLQVAAKILPKTLLDFLQ
jgi:flagellar hook-associated protein 3 FlgL